MFPTRYIQAKDGCAIDLYTSQEGKVWHLAPGSPVLEMSDYGQWDGGAIWALNTGLAELGDGSWVLPFRGDPGQPVMLRFRMRQARLYFLDFE